MLVIGRREEASRVPGDWVESDVAFRDKTGGFVKHGAERYRNHRCPVRGWRWSGRTPKEGRLLKEAAWGV